MSDSIGTVRRSPDGEHAMRVEREPGSYATWLGTYRKPEGYGLVEYNHWRTDRDVATWEVVYTPPDPIDRVLGYYLEGAWTAETTVAAILRIRNVRFVDIK